MNELNLTDNDPQGSAMLKTISEALAVTTSASSPSPNKKLAAVAHSPSPSKAAGTKTTVKKTTVAAVIARSASHGLSPSPLGSPPATPLTPTSQGSLPTAKLVKTVVKKSAKPPVITISHSIHEEPILFEADQTCIFCGLFDATFDEAALDTHFWKFCPMLKQCLHCKQVGFLLLHRPGSHFKTFSLIDAHALYFSLL